MLWAPFTQLCWPDGDFPVSRMPCSSHQLLLELLRRGSLALLRVPRGTLLLTEEHGPFAVWIPSHQGQQRPLGIGVMDPSPPVTASHPEPLCHDPWGLLGSGSRWLLSCSCSQLSLSQSTAGLPPKSPPALGLALSPRAALPLGKPPPCPLHHSPPTPLLGCLSSKLTITLRSSGTPRNPDLTSGPQPHQGPTPVSLRGLPGLLPAPGMLGGALDGGQGGVF